MANYEQLKTAVNAVIKTNGNNEITGAILQNVLNTIISTVGAKAQYTGVATPTTTPGMPDQNVYYLAAVPGTYPNFGNIVVNPGEIAIISNTASGWSKTSTGIASDMMQILVGIRYMDSPTRYKPSKTSGEALNGGVINLNDMEIVIPNGKTGYQTYVQFIYKNSKENGFNDAIDNGTPFKVLHKVQLGNDAATTIPDFLGFASGGVSWVVSRRIICTYKIGQYFYRLEEVTPTSQGTDPNNYLRTYMQIRSRTETVGFSAKYINSAVWISDERLELKIETDELNTLLGQLDYVTKDIYTDGLFFDRVQSALNGLLTFRPPRYTGKAFNGATVDEADKSITIPAGINGYNSYVQAYFDKGLPDAYDGLDYGYIYGCLLVKIDKETDANPSYWGVGLRLGITGTNVSTLNKWYKHPTDPTLYYIVTQTTRQKIDDTVVSNRGVFAIPLQVKNLPIDNANSRTFKILDAVIFVDNQGTVNIEFEKLGFIQVLGSDGGIIDNVEKTVTAIDLYEHMTIKSKNGTITKSNGQTFVTFAPNTNMFGVNYSHQLGVNGLGDVQVGDKIAMRDVVRVQRGTNTFTFEQLYRAAYMRINYTPTSGNVPVYYFSSGGTISAKLTKTAETDKYEFYEIIATITLNATQIAAIYSGTLTNMEITIMSNQELTLTDYFNVGLLSTYVGKIGTNAKWVTDIRNKEKRTEDELALIKSAIGMPYNTNYTDALVSLSSTLTTGTYRANGYTVAAGTSEKGNTIDLLLDWSRFFGKTPTEGTFDIFMNYNGTGEETFVIEAFDEKYNKLGDGTYWHDYNNNYIRVNFPIRGFRDMPRIIIRVAVSSELAKGYTMYYDHTVILGYGMLSPINARLLALEGMEQPNIVTSPSGKKFQITVTDDGVLGAQSFYFSKMLVITHSYGLHGRSDSLGWFPTEPWGMAASAKEKDYPHRLLAKMQTVNPEAEISHIVNVATFERNHNEPGFNFSDYDYLNAYDFDVIVIKIGENAGSNYPNMAEHLIELIDNHVGKNKNFKLFIASMFEYSSDTWDNQPVGMNNEFAKVATHYRTRLVMINKNGGSYGNQYTAYNPVNLLPPKDDGTQPDKNTEVYAGVLGHPGDTGMEMIASEFWTEIKRIYQITE